MYVLEVSNLRFSYGTRPVLQGISYSFEEGTLSGVFGPNGCGKTTLFKCCLRLEKAPKGTIRYGDRDLNTINFRELARTVAYVPQEHKPPFPYRVKEIVLMGRTPHLSGGLVRVSPEHRKAAGEALEEVGILELADLRYDELSGGQRQLVLIARAIAQQTPVLILDEPTSALDFSNQTRVWRLLKSLAARGKTVLTCSHDPNHVHWYCDRVITLNGGHIVAEGHPESALAESVLSSIYGYSCSVHRTGGTRVVLPFNPNSIGSAEPGAILPEEIDTAPTEASA